MVPQKIQTGLHFFHRFHQFILPKDRFFLAGERKFILIAHDDRLFGTDLFAESAEDAAGHIDLEPLRIPFLGKFRLQSPHATQRSTPFSSTSTGLPRNEAA